MFFTMDEVALIDGLIATYFVADSVSESVRVRYYETHQHLQDNRTDYVDLRNIKEALFFLAPLFHGSIQFEKDIWSVIANVVLNSGEGFVKAISDKLHLKFGNVKIAFDISCVIMAAVISLILSHKIQGVREGTFIAACFTGIIVKFLMKTLNKPVCRLLNIKN